MEPKKRRKKHDPEGRDLEHEEEAFKKESAPKSKAKQSDSGDNAHGGEVTFRKGKGRGKGNGARDSNPRRAGPELYSGNDEEEEDVKPTKSKRNGVKDRGGRKNHITKTLSSEEKALKKPAAKVETMKRDSLSSVFPDPEEEEDNTPSVQAMIPPSDDHGEQSNPESESIELADEPPTAKQNLKSKGAEPRTEKTKFKPAKSKEPSDQPAELDATKAEQSDSSMSILIDEPSKPKRNRKSGSAQPNPKTSQPTKTSKPNNVPSDPDSEEIKRLQSQLIKCGIRKMWFKELSPYPTPKSKIKHLKGMLADAGMTGRFSEAKAEQIKEERELRADLEAVQEGEKKWGKVEEEDGGGRGKRRLAKGFEGLGFLNDDDGEETD